MRERCVMKKAKKFLVVLLAAVMCMTGVFANTVNANAATTKKAAAVNSVYRNMIVSGDTAYYFGRKNLFSYNFKTKKCKKLATNISGRTDSGSPMLLYKGYVYYEADDSIYRVKADGSSKAKRICKDGELGFARNNRIYYGKNGLCSMKTDGSDKKQHVKIAKFPDYAKVFYYNGRYYFGDYWDGMYSVNTKFKKKKKVSNGYQVFVNATGYTASASNVEMNNGAICYTDTKTNSIVYCDKNNKTKTIYKSKKSVIHVDSYVGGYIIICELDESASGKGKYNRAKYKKGTYKIINLKGKVMATLKRSQI